MVIVRKTVSLGEQIHWMVTDKHQLDYSYLKRARIYTKSSVSIRGGSPVSSTVAAQRCPSVSRGLLSQSTATFNSHD